MVRSRQKKLIAAVIGVLLAGLPLAAFDIWLEQLVERQSSEDIFSNARRTIQLIDTRLTEVTAALDGLAAQGVASCGPADLEKLRRAALATSPAKEIGVIAPNGQMLCSDLGIPATQGALMLSVILGTAFVTRQFWGLISDRIGGI